MRRALFLLTTLLPPPLKQWGMRTAQAAVCVSALLMYAPNCSGQTYSVLEANRSVKAETSVGSDEASTTDTQFDSQFPWERSVEGFDESNNGIVHSEQTSFVAPSFIQAAGLATSATLGADFGSGASEFSLLIEVLEPTAYHGNAYIRSTHPLLVVPPPPFATYSWARIELDNVSPGVEPEFELLDVGEGGDASLNLAGVLTPGIYSLTGLASVANPFPQAREAEFSIDLIFGPQASGDFDGNGAVDGADFLELQRDPSVGDLADWQANFGSSTVRGSTIAVPEPSTFLAGLISLLAKYLMRTRIALRRAERGTIFHSAFSIVRSIAFRSRLSSTFAF